MADSTVHGTGLKRTCLPHTGTSHLCEPQGCFIGLLHLAAVHTDRLHSLSQDLCVKAQIGRPSKCVLFESRAVQHMCNKAHATGVPGEHKLKCAMIGSFMHVSPTSCSHYYGLTLCWQNWPRVSSDLDIQLTIMIVGEKLEMASAFPLPLCAGSNVQCADICKVHHCTSSRVEQGRRVILTETASSMWVPVDQRQMGIGGSLSRLIVARV